MREIKLQFETLPPPHYYRAKSGLTVAEVATDFGLSPFRTQILQYLIRVGRKSRNIADIVSDLEKIAQFAMLERDKQIAEAGGTIDRDTMTARFEGDEEEAAPKPPPGFDADGNMVRVIRCTRCGNQLQRRDQPRWRIGISDKWEHQCSVGGGWYAANDFWPIGIATKTDEPSPVDPEAEFKSLKVGDIIVREERKPRVIEDVGLYGGDQAVRYTFENFHVVVRKEDYVKDGWRKVTNA